MHFEATYQKEKAIAFSFFAEKVGMCYTEQKAFVKACIKEKRNEVHTGGVCRKGGRAVSRRI